MSRFVQDLSGWGRNVLGRLAASGRKALGNLAWLGSAPRKLVRSRHRWRIAIGILIALLIYPVLGTLALWSGLVERLARSEDLRLEIENPAYTIWPGRVHMKQVAIYSNGDTQFILRGKDLTLSISVLELVRSRIHVTKLAANDVRYQMRVQVKDTKGMEKRLAAYPKLEGLPGVNTILQKTAEKTESRESTWTVEVDGLDIRVSELWFFEYRYLGDGTLRGGFTVGPNLMEVRTAVQGLGPGQLRFGEKEPIAERFRGEISCNIPEVNPSEHADASFMELVSARANLKADMLTLKNVDAYFPELSITRGAGPLSFDLHMEKGYLGKQSKFDFETESVVVKGDGFGVLTDWKVSLDAGAGEGGLPLGKSDCKSTYVSLARRDKELTIQIHGHHEEATLDTIRLSGATDLKRASIRMPNIVSVDLKDLDVLLPETSEISVHAGEAKASLSLDMGPDYWAQGPVKAAITGTKLNVAGVNLSGNSWLDARARFNPKLKVSSVEGLSLRMRDIGMHIEDEDVDGWWLNLSSRKMTFWGDESGRAEGTISVRSKNLEPALEALAQKDVISDLIPILTDLEDFRAKTTFFRHGKTTDITVESESEIWDVSGRVYSTPKQSLMALVIGGQAVSIGIAQLGDGLEVRPFAKTDWLNSRLAKLPKPLVQLPAKKP
jgi:hypothetical protein